MTKVLEGMARAHWTSFADIEPKSCVIDPDDIEAMRAALLWLADNVSDDMLNAFYNEIDVSRCRRRAIAAALRQAAGGDQ